MCILAACLVAGCGQEEPPPRPAKDAAPTAAPAQSPAPAAAPDKSDAPSRRPGPAIPEGASLEDAIEAILEFEVESGHDATRGYAEARRGYLDAQAAWQRAVDEDLPSEKIFPLQVRRNAADTRMETERTRSIQLLLLAAAEPAANADLTAIVNVLEKCHPLEDKLAALDVRKQELIGAGERKQLAARKAERAAVAVARDLHRRAIEARLAIRERHHAELAAADRRVFELEEQMNDTSIARERRKAMREEQRRVHADGRRLREAFAKEQPEQFAAMKAEEATVGKLGPDPELQAAREAAVREYEEAKASAQEAEADRAHLEREYIKWRQALLEQDEQRERLLPAALAAMVQYYRER